MQKAGSMKDGTQNPGINVPFWSQEIITGMCFALKHRHCCREKFHPRLINLKGFKELWLQQEIEESCNIKVAYKYLAYLELP